MRAHRPWAQMRVAAAARACRALLGPEAFGCCHDSEGVRVALARAPCPCVAPREGASRDPPPPLRAKGGKWSFGFRVYTLLHAK
jgi:hypothetical protein